MVKSSLSLLILGLVLHSIIAEAQPNCGPNAEYTTCGSACPKTCDNTGENSFCTMQCVQGCECKKGFILNSEGSCVSPSQC